MARGFGFSVRISVGMGIGGLVSLSSGGSSIGPTPPGQPRALLIGTYALLIGTRALVLS